MPATYRPNERNSKHTGDREVEVGEEGQSALVDDSAKRRPQSAGRASSVGRSIVSRSSRPEIADLLGKDWIDDGRSDH